MTVALQIPIGQSPGDGIQTVFPYSYRVDNANEIVVYLDQTLVTNYTVQGVGNANGGTITFATAPGLNVLVTHYRVTELSQNQQYQNGRFLPVEQEQPHDKLTKIVQDLLTQHRLTVSFPPYIDQSLWNIESDAPVPLHVWTADATGTRLEWSPSTILQVIVDPVSGFINGKTVTPVPTVDGASVLTANIILPFGVEVRQATWRNMVTFGDSNGLTTISIGEPNIQDAWKVGLPRAAGAFTAAADRRRQVPFVVTNPLVILATAEGGTFDAVGEGKITTHWSSYTPDT